MVTMRAFMVIGAAGWVLAACQPVDPGFNIGDRSCRAMEGRLTANRLANQCSKVAISRVACTPARSCQDLRAEIDRGCAAIPPGKRDRPRFCPQMAR
jgi:hypothetical protein